MNSSLSVVMPNYNHGHYIGEALEAILAQSIRPLEVLVIDDASTDNSAEIIQQFVRRDHTVRLLRNEKNMGTAPTVNRGLQNASGDYVFFPAADDVVLPGLFEKSMNLLAQHPQAGLCSALTRGMGEHGEVFGFRRTPIISKAPRYLPPREALSLVTKHLGWFTGGTTIYRRDALAEVGGFDPGLGPFADGFTARVLALKYGACFIPELLAMTRRGANRYSQATMRDPDAALEIMRHAKHLMQTTYRDLFPPRWVSDWERQWLCTVAMHVVISSQRIQLAKLEEVASSQVLPDRAFFAGLRLAMKVQRIVTQLYLLLRFRYAVLLRPTELWNLIVRKLNRFTHRLSS